MSGLVHKFLNNEKWFNCIIEKKDEKFTWIKFLGKIPDFILDFECEGDSFCFDNDFIEGRLKLFVPMDDKQFNSLTISKSKEIYDQIMFYGEKESLASAIDLKSVSLQDGYVQIQISYGVRLNIEPVVVEEVTRSKYREVIGFMVIAVNDIEKETSVFYKGKDIKDVTLNSFFIALEKN